jgi:hypothetical protein
MSGRRRARASWLLVVLFATASLELCTIAASAFAGKPPCCADVGVEASFSSCCRTGQQSSPSDLPPAAQVSAAPAPALVFAAAALTSTDYPARCSSRAFLPYSSADRQALLSTFLI